MNEFSDILALLPDWRLKDMALLTLAFSIGTLLIVCLVTVLYTHVNFVRREKHEERYR